MNDLSVINSKEILWEGKENLDQVRQLFAKNLTQNEFLIFVEMGKLTGLNPYLKEMWAVKYKDTDAAQIFVGRDGYRKSAQRHPKYDYHTVDAVYSNDIYDVSNGEITHRYNLKDRGKLIGAYCIVQRKGSSRPTYVFVELSEYDKGFMLWKDKKATMIKKVAEAQGLKTAFQELFSGTYSEFEQWDHHEEVVQTKQNKGINGLKEKLGISVSSSSYEPVTGEIFEETVVEKVQNESPPTIEDVKSIINKSNTIEELIVAADLARSLPEADKKLARSLYKEKESEINKK